MCARKAKPFCIRGFDLIERIPAGTREEAGTMGAAALRHCLFAQASLVMRLYDPCGGRVLVDGVDAREYDLESLHAHMAMVNQTPSLFRARGRAEAAAGG